MFLMVFLFYECDLYNSILIIIIIIKKSSSVIEFDGNNLTLLKAEKLDTGKERNILNYK